jgi:hypothetical protein
MESTEANPSFRFIFPDPRPSQSHLPVALEQSSLEVMQDRVRGKKSQVLLNKEN